MLSALPWASSMLERSMGPSSNGLFLVGVTQEETLVVSTPRRGSWQLRNMEYPIRATGTANLSLSAEEEEQQEVEIWAGSRDRSRANQVRSRYQSSYQSWEYLYLKKGRSGRRVFVVVCVGHV
jgi:hypothetical protein